MKVNIKDLKFQYQLENDILLSPLKYKDASNLYKQVKKNRFFLNPWCYWVKHIHSLKDAKKFLNQYQKEYLTNQIFRLGIYHNSTLIGFITSLDFNWNQKSCYLGYWIDQDYQKKGYITKAVQFTCSLFFRIFSVKKYFILCHKDNYKSQGLAKKLGAQLMDQYEDICHYKLTKTKKMSL